MCAVPSAPEQGWTSEEGCYVKFPPSPPPAPLRPPPRPQPVHAGYAPGEVIHARGEQVTQATDA